MDKPTRLIEFETMLLGRYRHMTTSHAKSDGGHLERSAYILLNRIDNQGPMSVGELSEAFRLNPSTLTRQTTAMLRDGLVERIADPDAGIARKFRITDEGRRRLQAERDQIIASMDRIMADWSAEDIAAFAAFLRRFNTDLERLHGRPWPRA